MSPLCRYLLSSCLVFLLCVSKAASQEYIFNHLSIRDGLSSNNVLSLHQDGKGFLWIGTDAGLQRYDGYHFVTIAAKNLSGPVQQILADRNGIIWLRSGKTVGVFDGVRRTFTPVPVVENTAGGDDHLFRLNCDVDKGVFVAVQGAGCFYLNKERTAFSKAAAPFTVPYDWNFFDVLHDTIRKRYWLYGRSGLGYFDATDNRFHASASPATHPLLTDKRLSSDISNFYIDSRRRYWIERWHNGKQQYFCFDEKKNAYTSDTAGLYSVGNGGYAEIHHFTQFSDTVVLAYGLNCMSMTEHGVFTGFRSPVYTPYNLQFDRVNNVLEDREHILWVATDDGLYNTMANVNNSRHKMVSQQSGRSVINCLLEDEGKNIWLGMWGRPLIVLDSTLEKQGRISSVFEKAAATALKMTWAIHQHSRTQKIWIGCQDGTLAIYDPSTARLQVQTPVEFNHRTVRQIAEDEEGGLWFGLQSGGLFYCNPTDKTPRFEEVHRFDGYVSKIKIDAKGLLWIGVEKRGLYLLDPGSKTCIKTFTDKGALSGNNILDVLPVNDSTCVLAGEGLDILNPLTGCCQHLTAYNRLPLGIATSLQKGTDHECWFSTSNGLYRYNLRTGNLMKYSQWDGLVTVFNNGFVMEQSLRLKNGKIVFAGNQNLVLFDPARYKGTAVPPPVQLTAFTLGGTPLPLDSVTALSSLRLSYHQNSFTVDFAALAFTQLEKLTYEYKLTGADKDWTSVNLPEGVKYSLLPPGDYIFMVRVKNGEGAYAKTDARLHIIIKAPFWKSYPFRGLMVLSVGILLYSLHRLRVKRLLHVEGVRSRLARDLHDDMGSTLSTINILSNMALQQKGLDDTMNKTFMTKISESTTQMMEAMDDIIWSINPANDSMGKVLARMKQVAGAVLEPQGIDYSFEADEAVKSLQFSMEGRREIFLIYKEAINNIIKYAGCSKVDVTLARKRAFILIIADNGVGFDTSAKKENAPTRGNGFVNMQKRATMLKASLQITSSPGNGTRLILTVPFA